MTDTPVFHPGGPVLDEPRSRRRRLLHIAGRLLHIAGVVLLAVALSAIALLVLRVPEAGGPPRPAPIHAAPAATPSAKPHASVSARPHASGSAQPHPSRAARALTSYGTRLAPSSERVMGVRLGRGLRSGLLFDVRTGRVLWSSDPGRTLPIASLTKMMTALVTVAHTKPGDSALITTEATHFSGSGVGLLPLGKRVPVQALLYGLLLPSGNDAAAALAQHVAGSQRRFVEMMNTRARMMGLRCSHFNTVSGLVDRGNYSCATDLAALAHAVLRSPRLAPIVASRSAILPFPIKGHKLYLFNNNPLLLLRYPGADGVKTGFTAAAGTCLVATARRGQAWLGVVLLHSANVTEQAEKLLGAGFTRLAAVRRSGHRGQVRLEREPATRAA